MPDDVDYELIDRNDDSRFARCAPSPRSLRNARLLEHLPGDVRDAERRVVAAVRAVLNRAEDGVDIAAAHRIRLATVVAGEGSGRARALVEVGPGREVRLGAGEGETLDDRRVAAVVGNGAVVRAAELDFRDGARRSCRRLTNELLVP